MGKLLCRLWLHRWRTEQAKGVSGRAVFDRCTRCGKERYSPDARVPPTI